jgi:SAM-dependent methyltransferase
MTPESKQQGLLWKLDEPAGPGPFAFSPGQQISIAGWLMIQTPPGVPPITLSIVNARTGAATPVAVRRCPRPDVAAHFRSQALLMSGFTSTLRIDDRWMGQHVVRLSQGSESPIEFAFDACSFTIAPTAWENSSRRELATRFLTGAGLEVGALQRRLPVPDHCSVKYVDRLPLEELLAHYPELRGLPIQAPDLIDDGETLSKVESGSVDFVVANHLLEHCENPVQTIENFLRTLKVGGILFMGVPDKRFTFDIDRPVTPYAVLAETYREGRRRNRESLYWEWAKHVAGASPPEVDQVARKLLAERYSIHFNVWALEDLLEFIAGCRREFGLPFRLEWITCSENEVIVILRKHHDVLPG